MRGENKKKWIKIWTYQFIITGVTISQNFKIRKKKNSEHNSQKNYRAMNSLVVNI